MAKDDQEESFEKVLSSQLGRTLDFVKFAEAKNAALLTFSSAWIVAAVNLLNGQNQLPMGFDRAFLRSIDLHHLIRAAHVASFLQTRRRCKKPAFLRRATFPIAEYKERLAQRYRAAPEHSVTESYLDDLCVQISVNAQIAKRKFKMFDMAARCADRYRSPVDAACLVGGPISLAFSRTIGHCRSIVWNAFPQSAHLSRAGASQLEGLRWAAKDAKP